MKFAKIRDYISVTYKTYAKGLKTFEWIKKDAGRCHRVEREIEAYLGLRC